MKNLFLASVLFLSFSQLSLAGPPNSSYVVQATGICPAIDPVPRVSVIPRKDRAALSQEIRAAILKETDFPSFRDYSVDWDSADCTAVQSEMDRDSKMGVCIVAASAFQMYAKVAVIKKQVGYSVTLIFADVE